MKLSPEIQAHIKRKLAERTEEVLDALTLTNTIRDRVRWVAANAEGYDQAITDLEIKKNLVRSIIETPNKRPTFGEIYIRATHKGFRGAIEDDIKHELFELLRAGLQDGEAAESDALEVLNYLLGFVEAQAGCEDMYTRRRKARLMGILQVITKQVNSEL